MTKRFTLQLSEGEVTRIMDALFAYMRLGSDLPPDWIAKHPWFNKQEAIDLYHSIRGVTGLLSGHDQN